MNKKDAQVDLKGVTVKDILAARTYLDSAPMPMTGRHIYPDDIKSIRAIDKELRKIKGKKRGKAQS